MKLTLAEIAARLGGRVAGDPQTAVDQVGSLEVGKQATLIITTGTPLDMTSVIEQDYIQGRKVDMNDIQKHFFKKYMEKITQQKARVAM